MTTIAEQYELELVKPFLAETDQFYCGTEYEIEDVKHINLPDFQGVQESARWYGDIGVVADHSLRNNGVEFLTVPCTFSRAIELFTEIRSKLKLGDKPYTHRTSTHVHVNVANMTPEQLRHMVLLYAITEPVFFAVAGKKRKHNIHCVPLQYTLAPASYTKDIFYFVDSWSKYSAFNLLPVSKQGTVEFRHLFGTGDVDVYHQWLSIIEALWSISFDKPNTSWLHYKLKEGKDGYDIAKEIYGSAMPALLTRDDFYQSTIDVKLAFV